MAKAKAPAPKTPIYVKGSNGTKPTPRSIPDKPVSFQMTTQTGVNTGKK